MLSATLAAALATGLLGSVHCTAMCGPLAMAGCTRDSRVHAGDMAGYLLGRAFMYALAGACMGVLGAHAAHLLPVELAQNVALAAVAVAAGWRGLRLLRPAPLVKLPRQAGPFVRAIGRFIPKRGASLGLATGLLPCGLLLTGWMLAASTAHPAHGALTMLAFSVATAPALLLPVAAGRFIQSRFKRVAPAWYGVAWCGLAIWVGIRPLMTALHGGH